MKLKPFDEEQVTKVEAELVEDNNKAIANIMQAAGLSIPAKLDKAQDLDDVRKLFKAKGAGIDDVAKTIGDTMRSGDSDGIRLKAAELALKVHGIFSDMSEKDDMVININVAGDGNVINLLTPRG